MWEVLVLYKKETVCNEPLVPDSALFMPAGLRKQVGAAGTAEKHQRIEKKGGLCDQQSPPFAFSTWRLIFAGVFVRPWQNWWFRQAKALKN